MLIILEGCDGSGKSTLAKLLNTKFAASVVHHGPYKGMTNPELSRQYLFSMLSALRGEAVIMDRSWLSEPIYAEVYRKTESRLPRHHVRMLERVALTAGAIVVNCLPSSVDTCLRAFEARRGEELLESTQQLRAVYDRYAQLETGLPTVRYDYQRDPEANDLCQVLDAALQVTYNKGPGAGLWGPDGILIVGDRANAATHQPGMLWVPFINFNETGCSGWLARQCEAAGVPEHHLYWVNATTPDGAEQDPGFVQLLKPKVIITLGGNAAAWAAKHCLPHKAVPHPQHHKRFYHDTPYPLINALKEAIA